MKKIAIVLLNYKSKLETAECLDSLGKINKKNFDFEVIVVDNSVQDTGNFLKDKIEKIKKIPVKLIESQENTGFTGGNNLGIARSLANGYDYTLLLNNDTITDSMFLVHLFDKAESDKKIGIVVPKIYFAKGHEYHKDRYERKDLGNVIWYAGGIIDWANVVGVHKGVDEVDEGQFDEDQETEYATGACMLIKREVIEQVGMFDEKYFLYYEDSDLSMRVKQQRYSIIFTHKSKIWHKNASSSGGSGSSLQDYYTTRNRLLFANKYAPLRTKVALFRESMSLLISGRKYQKRGVKDYYKHNFGKGKNIHAE